MNNNNFRKFIYWIVPLIAILLPFFVIRTFPKFHHVYDIRAIQVWAEDWDMGWRDIYLNCPKCNYPFLGTTLSAGLMNSIDYKSVVREVNRFRYYLAIADGLNVLLIWFILSKLQVRAAPLWAGLIGLLPSSWIGSSVWGQIDGVGQSLILIFFSSLVVFNAKPRRAGAYYVYLAASGFLLSLMLMTKQLIYFSMLALGIILLANIFLRCRRPQTTALSILTVTLFLITPVLLVDANIKFDKTYFSHIHYILATGSDHGDIISSLGFNIWSLFTNDALGSSHIPLKIGGLVIESITPYGAGLVLFGLLNIAILYLFIRDLRQSYRGSPHFNSSQLLASLIYLAMFNISFNVALTGTHERYLFHFFSFILAASIIWRHRPIILTAFIGAALYSAYLFSYLAEILPREDQVFVQTASVVHLILFLYLFVFWMRNPTSRALDVTQA